MRKKLRKALSTIGVLDGTRSGVAVCDERVRFNGDGLATLHNTDFVHEAKFSRAYQAGISTPHSYGNDLAIHWRVRVAIWAAEIGLTLEGDFVECGVNSGILSKAVMQYTQFQRETDRTFYLLDTFCGLVSGTIDERTRQSVNRSYPNIHAEVVETFKQFDNAVIVQGAIPGTLSQITSTSIAYLSIDLNCVQPEQDAIEALWPRLSAGAVVVIDDYGFRGHEPQKHAWDRFAASRQVPLLPMPTGQALIIKPSPGA